MESEDFTGKTFRMGDADIRFVAVDPKSLCTDFVGHPIRVGDVVAHMNRAGSYQWFNLAVVTGVFVSGWQDGKPTHFLIKSMVPHEKVRWDSLAGYHIYTGIWRNTHYNTRGYLIVLPHLTQDDVLDKADILIGRSYRYEYIFGKAKRVFVD